MHVCTHTTHSVRTVCTHNTSTHNTHGVHAVCTHSTHSTHTVHTHNTHVRTHAYAPGTFLLSPNFSLNVYSKTYLLLLLL